MKKVLLTYVLLIASLIPGRGERMPKITFGAEWGYMPALFSGYHYNFFDPDGFRVDDKNSSFRYVTNGEVTLHAGYNFNEYWNLSFHTGYSGNGDFAPVVPMSLRITRYLGGNHLSDRWLTFLECGSGISIKNSPQEIFTGKVGGGYRISLSRFSKLDFIAAFRMLYTHPDIMYYEYEIPRELINRNDGYVGSLFLGLSLTF